MRTRTLTPEQVRDLRNFAHRQAPDNEWAHRVAVCCDTILGLYDAFNEAIKAGRIEVRFLLNEPEPEPEPGSNRPPQFKGATCRGSYVLGTACGNCERCAWERQRMAARR